MDISAIPPILPHISPVQSARAAETPNLAAIQHGPESAPRIDPADFGGPEHDKTLLQQLTVVSQEPASEMTQTRLMEKLQTLQTLKRSTDPKDKLEAVKEFGRLAAYKSESARNTGIAGLLSMTYTNSNPEIANVLHGLLIGILNPATIGSPEDFEFLAQSILDALTADKEAMQHTSIQQVLTSIDRFGLDKINGLKPSIEKFVSAPASEIGQSISELSTGLVGKGALSISELVAAENVRNVPIPAALRTESKEPARPNIDVLLSALRQVRSMIIYSLWPSLMKDTNLVYLVVLLGRIDQNLTRRRRKMRQLKTALVTHPSATLTDELLARSPVWVIDNDPENYIRIFHDMFHSLKESGFQSVFALLPHSDFWHSYHHARHALSRPIPNITIIDTKLYGLGLGILVREVNHRLAKLNRRDEVDAVIRKVAAQIHYWIVPVYTKNINGHFWFQKMKRQSNWKDAIHAKHIPIIGFGESTGIVAAGVDLTQSLIKLEGMIVETFQRTASSPRIIVIEHHNQLPAANGLANYFRSMYRSTKIIIQQAAPFMANEIGPYIGIVAI